MLNVQMNDKYKSYYNTLIGKQQIEQFVNVFENRNDGSKYAQLFMDEPKFWIANITKYMFEDNMRYLGNPLKGAYTYSLYMFKDKDLTILMVPLVCVKYSINYDSNIRSYLVNNIIRKKGYKKWEFKQSKTAFGYGPYSISMVKILIDNDKTEDDLINLISSIEKFNNYILNNDLTVWDSYSSVKENVKIDL